MIPAFIYSMDRNEAVVAMVDSNLHREKLLPSEKAFAYKLKRDALSHQGKASHQPGEKLPTSAMIGKESGDSMNQVLRYIRLTNLIPGLLDMVDEGQMAMRPAIELSFIPKVQQGHIWECMDAEQCTPSHAQAIRMRQMCAEKKLTPEVIEAILLEEKPNQKERIVLSGERFKRLFPPDLPSSKREDYIAAAMEYYAKHRHRQRDRDDVR